MSLKLIELQVALPRIQDAGKLQEQLQQRGQNMSDIVAQMGQRDADKLKSTIIKNEQSNKINNERNRERGSDCESGGSEKETDEQKCDHPYKGNVIDYSG
ncbi:hypothetical protein [Cytobacillus purgationiresistens]|uniref:Uncharacterized protein n=1 Tax=Cytobacillus purgationiresistens TaxID=863449 RepID=A0ABU0AHE2_9BACI|nr:hypothetical protein [Cytobacillus purgationiresistens]MDQ0270202.1 hypothetical protein [Cytobacillus purgationiresistens]